MKFEALLKSFFRRVTLSGLLILLFLNSGLSKEVNITYFPKEVVEQRIDFFIELVDALYLPKFYDIDTIRYDSLKQELTSYKVGDSLSEIEVFQLFSNYLHHFENGHARMIPPSITQQRGTRLFPLQLFPFDSTLAVVATSRRSSIPVGGKLISIDSMDVPKILAFAESNGYGETELFRTIYGIINFSTDYFLVNPEKEFFDIRYIPPHSDSIHTAQITALPQRKRCKIWWSETEREFRGEYRCEFNETLSYGLFSIPDFRDEEKLFRELDRFLDGLEKNSCNTIVFDLRNNFGGYVETLLPLFYAIVDTPSVELVFKRTFSNSFIACNKKYGVTITDSTHRLFTEGNVTDTLFLPLNNRYKNNYENDLLKGKDIYCLVNRNSYSAATILPYLLQQNGAAKVIGEGTHQPFPVHAAPEDFTIRLGKKTFKGEVPLMTISTNGIHNDNVPLFLESDYFVKESYDDFLHMRDPIIEELESIILTR